MSALSFLSKKSWHTGLQTNQKAVWEAEKAALDERKKLDELRKERERERELQELERLHEQSGGKKARRQERVDWMYNAPSSGGNVNADELEDYLLGKKRVDKLLKADETNQLSRGAQAAAASTPSQASTSNVLLNDRDLASKVREDPMLSIRQQEQAAYQALLKDPARLRAMRKAAGLVVGESKEERRRRKEEKHRRREERRDRESDRDHSRYGGERYERRDDSRRSRHRDGEYDRRDDRREEGRRSRHQDEEYDRRDDRRQDRSNTRHSDARSASDQRRRTSPNRSRSRSPPRHRFEPRRSQRTSPPPPPAADEAARTREAKLAAMQQNASQLSSSRQSYLAKVKADEEADLAREQALRERVRQSRTAGQRSSEGQGFGSSELKGSFMLDQERMMYGSSGGDVDLAERLRRGRDTLQRFDGD